MEKEKIEAFVFFSFLACAVGLEGDWDAMRACIRYQAEWIDYLEKDVKSTEDAK